MLQRAPLVLPAIALALGVTAGRYLSLPIGFWIVPAVAGLAVCILCLVRTHLAAMAPPAVLLAIFCGGALSAHLAYWRVSEDHIVHYSDARPVLCTIRGEVASLPRIVESKAVWSAPPSTLFLLEANSIAGPAPAGGVRPWLATNGLVRVQVDEPLPDLLPGRRVELVGTMYRFRSPSNPGQYDWRESQRQQGIHVSLSVPAASGLTLLDDTPAGYAGQAWQHVRILARRHVENLGEHQDGLLVEALVLGDRDPTLQKLNQAMMEAGTAHLLSISGSHLAIFLGFLYCLCRLLAISPKRSAALVLVVLVAYVLLTDASPPLLRSAIMAGTFCLAVMLGRSITGPNVLAAAGILLLAADPLQLFTAGFQLSFGIVAGMVCLYRPLRQRLFGRFLQTRGLVVFRTTKLADRVRRWLYYSLSDFLINTAAVSLAAYIASVPLVAYHFGLFSPYASILTVLLTPVMTLVLVPAYLSLALAWLLPNASATIGSLAAWAAGLMQWLVMKMALLPFISIDLYPVPVVLVVLFYLAVALWALSGRFRLGWLAAGVVTLAVAGVFISTQRAAPPPGHPQLHVLDVSHGSMAVLEDTDGRTYLFDAGTLSDADCYQQVLRPFLREKRLRPPTAVFVSHANLDHHNALPGMLRRCTPQTLYINEFFATRPDDPPSSRELLRLCQAQGVQIRRLAQGETIPLHGDTRVEVVWPPHQADMPTLSANDSSLVLRLAGGSTGSSPPSGKTRVLLPGDIGEFTEEVLFRLWPEGMRCDVLVLPHHGSVTPTLKSLIEAAGPAILVQSNARRQQPPALLEALGNRPRYATFRDGWICVGLAPDGPIVQTMRERP